MILDGTLISIGYEIISVTDPNTKARLKQALRLAEDYEGDKAEEILGQIGYYTDDKGNLHKKT